MPGSLEIDVSVIPRWRYWRISRRSHIIQDEKFEVRFTVRNVGKVPIESGFISFAISWGQLSSPIDQSYHANHDQIPVASQVIASTRVKAELPGNVMIRNINTPSASLHKKTGFTGIYVHSRDTVLSGYHNFTALVIVLATLLFSVSVVAYPQITAAPDIETEIDPSLGYFETSNIYATTRRNPEKEMPVTFTVRIHNTGTDTAHNIFIKMSQTPQPNDWYNFHEAFVYPPGIRSYRTDTGEATIFILKPGESAEIDFHVTFLAPDYDVVINLGEDPTIYFSVTSEGLTYFSEDYFVRIP